MALHKEPPHLVDARGDPFGQPGPLFGAGVHAPERPPGLLTRRYGSLVNFLW